MQDTIYQPSEKSILLELLNTDSLLDKYEHNLRGEVLVTKKDKDDQGKDIIVQRWEAKFPPKMNDMGVTSTMAFLRIICDKSISMTDLDEEKATMLAMQNADDWIEFLNTNSANFGLKTQSQIKEVYMPIRDLIIVRFHSNIDGMIVNAIAKTTNVTEDKRFNSEQQNPDSQKPSIFGRIWPKV